MKGLHPYLRPSHELHFDGDSEEGRTAWINIVLDLASTYMELNGAKGDTEIVINSGQPHYKV